MAFMFDFIRKDVLWHALDQGYEKELDQKIGLQLKHAQDLAIYSHLRDKRNLTIAEIGGGDSRILRRLATHNTCYNIDKFGGADGGPVEVIEIPKVQNVNALIGEFDLAIPVNSVDVTFSVSVVEHIELPRLDLFHRDMLRMLKPGGMFLHAIDLYISDEPSQFWKDRYEAYFQWVNDDPEVTPLKPGKKPPLAFSCSMASNPDHVLHSWGKLAPALTDLRKRAQNVSLLVGGRKAA